MHIVTMDFLTQLRNRTQNLVELESGVGQEVPRFYQQYFPDGMMGLVFQAPAGDAFDLALFAHCVQEGIQRDYACARQFKQAHSGLGVGFKYGSCVVMESERQVLVPLVLDGKLPENLSDQKLVCAHFAELIYRLTVPVTLLDDAFLSVARYEVDVDLGGALETWLPQFNDLLAGNYENKGKIPKILVDIAAATNPEVRSIEASRHPMP